ncbi:hypothetical protein LTR49_027930 [Elasticomyces elasticus]|nr:hypothetical protein LTR49_027930 [Elasticomyces elasticus]
MAMPFALQLIHSSLASRFSRLSMTIDLVNRALNAKLGGLFAKTFYALRLLGKVVSTASNLRVLRRRSTSHTATGISDRPTTDAPTPTPAAVPGDNSCPGGTIAAGLIGTGVTVTFTKTTWVLVKTAPLEEYVIAFVVEMSSDIDAFQPNLRGTVRCEYGLRTEGSRRVIPTT